MNDDTLNQLRDIIQEDVGKRGLAKDPERNLINACPGDFAASCRSLAEHPRPALAVVTGFFIPTGTPAAGETDGPLGALFLARALTPLGIPVVLVTDDFCMRALVAGLGECGLGKNVPLIALPTPTQAKDMTDAEYRRHVTDRLDGVALTHLLAIERVGPNDQDRCHTMRGRDITELMSPAHRLFLPSPSVVRGGGVGGEGDDAFGSVTFSSPALHAPGEIEQFPGSSAPSPPAPLPLSTGGEGGNVLTTVGIGDGGNEIGMGKIPRAVIANNIPNGQLVACRIATQHLIVCGISNWGAYALAAGVAHVRGQALDASLFDPKREQQILDVMVQAGPLVDGVTGQPTATVDGLTWQQYVEVLVKIGARLR